MRSFSASTKCRHQEEGDRKRVEETLKAALDEINKNLWESIEAIRSRKPEAEIAGVVGKINPADLQKAIDLTENRATQFDKAARDHPTAYGKAADAANQRDALVKRLQRRGQDSPKNWGANTDGKKRPMHCSSGTLTTSKQLSTKNL